MTQRDYQSQVDEALDRLVGEQPAEEAALALAVLINRAVAHGRAPMPRTGGGYTVVKSISAKQRPRRPPR